MRKAPVNAENIPDTSLVGFSSLASFQNGKTNPYDPVMPMINISQCRINNDTLSVNILSGMLFDGLIARINIIPKDSIFYISQLGIAKNVPNDYEDISQIQLKKNSDIEMVSNASLTLPAYTTFDPEEILSGILVLDDEITTNSRTTIIFQCNIE